MWTAKYVGVDKNGLKPEVRVNVRYSNDYDDATFEEAYDVLPNDLKSESFTGIVQKRLDLLELKDLKVENLNLDLETGKKVIKDK